MCRVLWLGCRPGRRCSVTTTTTQLLQAKHLLARTEPARRSAIAAPGFDPHDGSGVILPSKHQPRSRGEAHHGAELVVTRVEMPEHAGQARFLGSPSVRVDGRDVEPGADARTDFAMKCRLYRNDEGQSGVPPRAWIAGALHAAR